MDLWALPGALALSPGSLSDVLSPRATLGLVVLLCPSTLFAAAIRALFMGSRRTAVSTAAEGLPKARQATAEPEITTAVRQCCGEGSCW
jgi:hypothetical protein